MSSTITGPGGAQYLVPNMSPMAYKTYCLVAPVATHFRNGTCEETECEANQKGWTTIVDVASELGRSQAYYIRMHSGRSFTVTEVGTLITFSFPPGQKCFAEHKIKLERDPNFFTYHGDWRGRFSDPIRRTAGDWLDDFANHQDGLKTAIERG